MPQSADALPVGLQADTDTGADINAHAFLIKQILDQMAGAAIVQVRQVYPSDGQVGRVDVWPMVGQMDGNGRTVQHGVVNNLPYFRYQGGSSAVIIDPRPGDIGLAIFADRDISVVKNSGEGGPPASKRRHSWSDGLYIGGFLNKQPTQFVKFEDDGIRVVSPTRVRIEAPSVDVIGNLTATGTITTLFGTANSVTLHTHIHPDNGIPPVPGS